MATHHIPATDQTVHWGFFRLLASLISVAGDFGVTQVVDQRQGVHGMIAKSLFVPAAGG
jgi:hypothetical protein